MVFWSWKERYGFPIFSIKVNAAIPRDLLENCSYCWEDQECHFAQNVFCEYDCHLAQILSMFPAHGNSSSSPATELNSMGNQSKGSEGVFPYFFSTGCCEALKHVRSELDLMLYNMNFLYGYRVLCYGTAWEGLKKQTNKATTITTQKAIPKNAPAIVSHDMQRM